MGRPSELTLGPLGCASLRRYFPCPEPWGKAMRCRRFYSEHFCFCGMAARGARVPEGIT